MQAAAAHDIPNLPQVVGQGDTNTTAAALYLGRAVFGARDDVLSAGMHIHTRDDRRVTNVLPAQAAGEGFQLFGAGKLIKGVNMAIIVNKQQANAAAHLRQKIRGVHVHALFHGAGCNCSGG